MEALREFLGNVRVLIADCKSGLESRWDRLSRSRKFFAFLAYNLFLYAGLVVAKEVGETFLFILLVVTMASAVVDMVATVALFKDFFEERKIPQYLSDFLTGLAWILKSGLILFVFVSLGPTWECYCTLLGFSILFFLLAVFMKGESPESV